MREEKKNSWYLIRKTCVLLPVTGGNGIMQSFSFLIELNLYNVLCYSAEKLESLSEKRKNVQNLETVTIRLQHNIAKASKARKRGKEKFEISSLGSTADTRLSTFKT